MIVHGLSAKLSHPAIGDPMDQSIAVCADRDEALLLADGSPAPQRIRAALEPVPGAARRGRDLAGEACVRWRIPELLIPVSIVTSELVSNAVQHAGTPFELSFAATPDYLRVAVRTPAAIRWSAATPTSWPTAGAGC